VTRARTTPRERAALLRRLADILARDASELARGVPFGGIGISGVGRENGARAIRNYTETKAIWVDLSHQSRDPFKLG
jgi:(Z)-2-((N-methylformamido)methylene)-5-hydroxybutyrolactone dehydrogenase